MIKGINKQVLEIFETENGYFEKALFFVKPEFSGFSENKLKELAKNEINKNITPAKIKTKTKKNKIKLIISLIFVFVLGVISGLFFNLQNFI